jgi:apolipoprotein D and lipocalin family protein
MFKFLFILSLLAPAVSHAELQTVPFVDVARYAGDWYQISHIPMWFEGGNCACARQRLTANAKPGVIDVFNSCNTGDARGESKTIRGEATNDDVKSNSKFTVDFHQGFLGTYWIIGLDPDYRFAVVSDKDQISLYILSKTPTLAPDLYAQAMALAAKQLDTSKVVLTDQKDCSYPQ